MSALGKPASQWILEVAESSAFGPTDDPNALANNAQWFPVTKATTFAAVEQARATGSTNTGDSSVPSLTVGNMQPTSIPVMALNQKVDENWPDRAHEIIYTAWKTTKCAWFRWSSDNDHLRPVNPQTWIYPVDAENEISQAGVTGFIHHTEFAGDSTDQKKYGFTMYVADVEYFTVPAATP